MSPKGAAFLHARPDRQPLLEPLVVSWGWESDDPGPSRFVDEQEWTGTRDVAAYLSVPAALQFRQDHDWPAVQAACHALLRDVRQRVARLTGLPALTPDGSDWYGQMVTLPIPDCNEKELQRTLRREHDIEIPAIRWQDRPYLRVSAQGYNNAKDIDALIDALAKLL
jgi:isopenicillin-N epimerase